MIFLSVSSRLFCPKNVTDILWGFFVFVQKKPLKTFCVLSEIFSLFQSNSAKNHVLLELF